MKKRLLVAIIFAVSMVSALPRAYAGEVFRFRGEAADAFFSSTDPSGCVVTDVFVFAQDGTSQAPPGPGTTSSRVHLMISQFDVCTDTQLMAAGGGGDLADADFQVGTQLGSAMLSTAIDMRDFVSGSSFNVDVALTWTATGSVVRSNSHFHIQSPGLIINGNFNGASRSAEASGSVSDGATNFTPSPSPFAQIISGNNGQVTVD